MRSGCGCKLLLLPLLFLSISQRQPVILLCKSPKYNVAQGARVLFVSTAAARVTALSLHTAHTGLLTGYNSYAGHQRGRDQT